MNEELTGAIKGMSVEELTRLQFVIRREKQYKHVAQGIRFSGYIPEPYRAVIPVVLEYLKENDLIKRRTIYNLATMSVMLVIEDVIEKIKAAGELP